MRPHHKEEQKWNRFENQRKEDQTMELEQDVVQTLECICGCVFEVDQVEVDARGDRWARCPKCAAKIPVPEGD